MAQEQELARAADAGVVIEQTTPPPVFIRQTEAARRLSVSLRQFRRLIIAGKLSVFKPSRRLALVEWAEVERMIRASKESFAA